MYSNKQMIHKNKTYKHDIPKHAKFGNYFCFERLSEGLLVLINKSRRVAKKMWNPIDHHGSDLQKKNQ